MNRRVLDQVRIACKAVAERARHVQINYLGIASYAACLPLKQVAHPEHEPNSHYLGHCDDTVAPRRPGAQGADCPGDGAEAASLRGRPS